MTDEQTRLIEYANAIDKDRGYATGATIVMREAAAALDRLVAERDAALEREYGTSDAMDSALARAEAAEKERDEAQGQIDSACGATGFNPDNHAPHDRLPITLNALALARRTAERRADAAESRCTALEAALWSIEELDEDDFKSAWHYQVAVRFFARNARTAATLPAEKEGTP